MHDWLWSCWGLKSRVEKFKILNGNNILINITPILAFSVAQTQL